LFGWIGVLYQRLKRPFKAMLQSEHMADLVYGDPGETWDGSLSGMRAKPNDLVRVSAIDVP
jgi:hypothetical protein